MVIGLWLVVQIRQKELEGLMAALSARSLRLLSCDHFSSICFIHAGRNEDFVLSEGFQEKSRKK